MEHRPHFLPKGRRSVNLEGVLGELLLNLERAHGFRCHVSNWAQLMSVVLLLVDQNILYYLELVFVQFTVAKCLRSCLFMVQCTVDK